MSQLSSNTWPPKSSNWLETPQRISKSSVSHRDICSSPSVVMKNSTLWFAPLSLLVVSYLVSTVRCCSRLNKRRRQRRMPKCFLIFFLSIVIFSFDHWKSITNQLEVQLYCWILWYTDVTRDGTTALPWFFLFPPLSDLFSWFITLGFGSWCSCSF